MKTTDIVSSSRSKRIKKHDLELSRAGCCRICTFSPRGNLKWANMDNPKYCGVFKL